jgi:two-component system phosphate regulon sensor histidine kinase PhoR
MRATGQFELAALIRQQRDVLLSTWREQVKHLASAQNLDTPTLNDHIPQLLDELVDALNSSSGQRIPEALAQGSPPVHGFERFREGYDIQEVVAEYNILRGGIYDLVEKNGLSLEGESFHIMNGVLDRAIGLAVQTYATERALELQKRREEYLAFVAHDLRTPLNAVALAANVLEEIFRDGNAREDTEWMLKTLRCNVQQLRGLVEKIIQENTNLCGETRIKLERREFDLWPLVEALIYDLRPLAKTSGTELVNEVPHRLIVYADASLLKRVFQNLISNAIRHTAHGRVVLGARESSPDGTVDCWVIDDGAGIPKETLERLFDELESDSADGSGLGLGLAIIKSFVEAHGGRVSVESRQGTETKFRFTLPTKATCERAASVGNVKGNPDTSLENSKISLNDPLSVQTNQQ